MNVLPTNAEPGLDLPGIFDAIDFKGLKSVIVAVSGGSDSLALLYLLVAYRASQTSFPEMIAVTIDHGLRVESADEAHFVAGLCEKAGIAHRILNWTGPKPATGTSAKARDARYTLLCKAARDAGTDVVLTGHTRDDQIETFVMRLERAGAGRSERGLASMAPATLLEREVWLVRPLLDVPRERLRVYLRERDVVWRDDPSNDDSKYERVRVRKALREADGQKIARTIVEKASKRLFLNTKAAQALSDCVTIYNGTCAEIRRRLWLEQGHDTQQLAIGVLLATMGGRSLLPSTEICDKALGHVFSQRSTGRITINRCVLQSKKDTMLIFREMRSLPITVVEPDMTAIWDSRYRICNRSNQPITVGASGIRGLEVLSDAGHAGFHRASALSSPALYRDNEISSVLAGADHVKLPEGIFVTRHLALFDHVLSGYDEVLAKSVAKLFRLKDYKPSPVNQINKN